MDIQKSIVAILDKKKKIIGTGFVAGESLILTCAHVVETDTSGLNEPVIVRFAVDGSEVVAQVDAQSFSPSYEQDVALLRVDALPQDAKPLPLAPAAAGCSLISFKPPSSARSLVPGLSLRDTLAPPSPGPGCSRVNIPACVRSSSCWPRWSVSHVFTWAIITPAMFFRGRSPA